MEELSQHLKKIKVPERSDKVYKDECVYSFDTPETPTGLYVSLSSFFGLGQDHVERYFRQTGNAVFLHILKTKKEIPNENMEGPEKKITRLAIGTPGGFNPDQQKYTFEENYKIVLMPNFTSIPYPNEELPMLVQMSVKAILEAESAMKIAEQEALAGTWDGEATVVSKHAENLLQLDNGIKIPPSGWKCEKCELTQNLWLNLTDGSILCGRKFFDGSGGNDHAVEHYHVSRYPLAVKLGTITKDGKGDVYSYDEDDMVLDPKLVEHLAHWGVNITQMEKTEKSMIELELDLNQKFGDWVTLQESSSKVYGPGYTGLVNLGNSCYLNSVMQTMFLVPDFVERFVNKADEIFNQNIHDPPNDFNAQMAKLGVGLLSGKYSEPPKKEGDEPNQGISPRMFKTLVGRGHQDFCSNRQQDAQEFFLHLINLLEQNSRQVQNVSDCFKFKVEERYQCNSSKKVQYTSRPEYLLPLPIALDCAINKEQVAAYLAKKDEAEKNNQKLDFHDIVRPRIKLSSCLETFGKSETIEQFYSTALKEKTTAVKTTRLATFPDYLLIHLKKFTAKEDWTPIKLDVEVEMPDLLDLSWLEGKGLQPDEESLPEVNESEHPQPQFDPAIINQLAEMGFPLEACKRAVFFSENGGFEEATAWLMMHIADDNFAEPFVPPGLVKKNQNSFVPDEEGLATVMSMGFTKDQATKALKATNNNVERAVDWIFSHASELDETPMEEDTNSKDGDFRNGSGCFKLVGFISHMGTSSMVGHYVCHLLKDDRWIIFNDEKVAVSENPPKDLGYIYMYQRLD